jgi:hypothetical protein
MFKTIRLDPIHFNAITNDESKLQCIALPAECIIIKVQWSEELLLIAYRQKQQVYIGIYHERGGLKSRVKMECSEISSFEVVKKVICTCEDGVIKLY